MLWRTAPAAVTCLVLHWNINLLLFFYFESEQVVMSETVDQVLIPESPNITRTLWQGIQASESQCFRTFLPP